MRSITRVKGVLTAAGQFVGPVAIDCACATVFVSGTFNGTLTVQIRPTPLPAQPSGGVVGKPLAPAETPEAWSDLQTITADGLTFVPANQVKISGRYDIQVGYKPGSNPTGTATVYLQTEDYAS